MKRKRVRCEECGTKYRARALRCPMCETPNPLLSEGRREYDKTVAIVLIAIGLVTAVPVAALLIGSAWMGGTRGIRAAAAGILLSVIPIGSAFHGVLLLCGIHPREFYSWWERLPGQVKGFAWLMVALLIVGFIILFFFGEHDEF